MWFNLIAVFEFKLVLNAKWDTSILNNKGVNIVQNQIESFFLILNIKACKYKNLSLKISKKHKPNYDKIIISA